MPSVHNNTSFSPQEINTFPVLGMTVSNWRQRNVVLHQHPLREDYVISVGTSFDERIIVICAEHKEQWQTALHYAAHHKVYISN